MDYRNNNAVLRDVVITPMRHPHPGGRGAHHRRPRFREQPAGRFPATCASRPRAATCAPTRPIVSFRNKLISAATITGTPAQFEQQRDDGTTARGHANTIDYETAERHRELQCANAWLSYGRNEITGQQLVYNIRTQSVEGQSRRSPAPDRRWPHAHRDPAEDQAGTQSVRQEKRPEQETMSVLRATHLAKSYKKRQVISDLSVEVESGQIVGLLGPNGAGKTTAFYMIVGLVPPDAGHGDHRRSRHHAPCRCTSARTPASATCRRKLRFSAS